MERQTDRQTDRQSHLPVFFPARKISRPLVQLNVLEEEVKKMILSPLPSIPSLYPSPPAPYTHRKGRDRQADRHTDRPSHLPVVSPDSMRCRHGVRLTLLEEKVKIVQPPLTSTHPPPPFPSLPYP